MTGIDFVTLAVSFGAEGARIEDYTKLADAMKTALNFEGSYSLDVAIDSNFGAIY